jgi:hypothetical protein
MRRYGLYDSTRGLTTAFAAGIAGLLLWVATLVGVGTTAHFWESMGIVAGAGLILALSQVIGGWTKGGHLRISPTTFAVAFLPVLVCVGWILMATQPGSGWHEGQIVTWSHDVGIYGLVHSLGLWHGALAFGFGIVLGFCFDTVPVPVDEPVVARDDTMVADDRGPAYRRRSAVTNDADEPMTAERDAAYNRERTTAERDGSYDGEVDREPNAAAVGPRRTEPEE